MAGQRQPTNLVVAKGKKHFTQNEIEERLAREVQPCTDNIEAPKFLNKKQTETFNKIAGQLKKLKIMGETDVDALARYIVANDFYIHAVKQMRKTEVKNNPETFEAWAKIQDRYYKQCKSSASCLGLDITSRCKLVVPATKPEAPPENKFTKFQKPRVVGG